LKAISCLAAFILVGAVPGFCQTPHRKLASIFNSKLAFYLPSPDSAPLSITQVLNATGEAATISQNTWIEIKGTNLWTGSAASTDWGGSPSFAQGLLPTSVGGVTATVNNKPAFIYYVSPTQINVLTPLDTALGAGVPVTITTPTGTGSATTTMVATSLGIFTANFTAPLYPAAYHAVNTCATPYNKVCLLGPTTLYPGLSTPAKPGETIVLFGNGFGQVTPPLVNGAASPAVTQLSTFPTMTIGGLPAKVDFAGIVAAGEYQFNVEVPAAAPNGDNLLVVNYNGATIQSNVFINVHN
jgi:uncharacterized protein (TIGR03437 family)